MRNCTGDPPGSKDRTESAGTRDESIAGNGWVSVSIDHDTASFAVTPSGTGGRPSGGRVTRICSTRL
jgi:hypothetical protein